MLCFARVPTPARNSDSHELAIGTIYFAVRIVELLYYSNTYCGLTFFSHSPTTQYDTIQNYM